MFDFADMTEILCWNIEFTFYGFCPLAIVIEEIPWLKNTLQS